MNFRILLSALVCVSFFSSCMTSRKMNYMQEGKNIPQYADSVAYSDYLVQKGDQLYVQVLSPDEDTQSLFNVSAGQQNSAALSSYLVYEDGTIDFPFVGTLPVESKTTREIKYEIEEALKMLMPTVSVTVQLSNRVFSVIGEVGSGRFQMPREKINVFQALAMFGDLTTFSNRGKIQLIRQVNGETKVFDFDVRSKSIIHSEYYYIQPNDVIYVPFLRAKAFGITHATSVLSTTVTTISFVMTLVNIGVLIKNATVK